jgi:aminopeptidase-like protein
MDKIKEALETLFPMDRQLLGTGYDNALEYINTLIGLEVKSVPSGTQVGTWTVPEEWVVKQAWLKKDGKKMLDYKKNPLSLLVYSLPFKGKVTREELEKHVFRPEELKDATPYVFKFYDRDWGFCMPEGELEEGEYEVCIETEFKPGNLKYGIHTIKGKSEREILIFAHLDHPGQANDNLSAVACLLDLAHKIKCEHTVKLVFCPETIGSQAFAYNENLSKVDFVIAIDICGNDNTILFQKSWSHEDRINKVAHCALQTLARPYRKGKFRTSIGSDETVFNDPLIGIPGVLLTRWPYKEYHTDQDTPEKIDYQKIEETGELVLKMIEIYEKDYTPVRLFRGPLMRSRYGIQSPMKVINLNLDYLFYSVDGKKTLAELCAEFEVSFDHVYEMFDKIHKDGQLGRIGIGEGGK